MNEYLFLFRGGNIQTGKPQSADEMQTHMEKWMQWMGGLKAEGKLVGAQPLETSGRVINGAQKIVTDGAFVEAKEVVGGYLACRAASYEEAVEIAKACPILEENGIVEIRLIKELII